MKPLKLEMQAFGPYAGKESIDFAAIDHGLFLICGPTGSGKTTIFDAIKYALYGATSNKERDIRDMRSSHAAPGDKTYVELTFEHAGSVYHILRYPQQIAPKKRGEGTRLFQAEAALENISTSTTLASKDSDVNEFINELLGIDAEQFSRIVMIAQNDFASVLNAGTVERQKLFRKIFGTQIYADAQNILDAKRKDLEANLAVLHTQLSSEIERITIPERDIYAKQQEALSSLEPSALNAQVYESILNETLNLEEDEVTTLDTQLNSIKSEIANLNVLIGKAQALQAAKQQAQDAQLWLDKHSAEVIQAQSHKKELEALEPQRNKLQIHIQSLEDSLHKYDELSKQQNNLNKLKNAQTATQETLKTSAEKLKKYQDNLQLLKEEQNQLAEAGVQLEKTTAKLKEIEYKLAQLNDLQDLDLRLKNQESNLDAKQQKFRLAEDLFGKANTKFNYEQSLYYADRAGMLAEELEPGEPCPVCGSNEHPQLAKRHENVVSEEELQNLEDALEKSREARQNAALAAETAKVQYEATQKELFKKAKTYFVSEQENLTAAISKHIQSFKQDMQNILMEQKNWNAKVQRIDVIQQDIQKIQNAIDTLIKQEQTLRSQLSQLDIDIAVAQTSVKELQASLQFESKDAVKDAITSFQKELSSMMREFEDACKVADELHSKQTEYKAKLDAAQSTLNTQESFDLEALQKQLNAKVDKDQELTMRISDLQALIRSHQQSVDALNKYMEASNKLNEEFASIDYLSNLANGKVAGKKGRVTFETFVQGTYFVRVLIAANERLNIMSSGRYSLEQRESQRDKRIHAGLEIDVLDRYTGTTRPAQTLSGGETFLASLALALGLSDVIMAQAGGMHIDAMFIDEGFGTLDDETCQLAVNVLEKLSSDDRMIGIISHVADLKNRISRQIQVSKTRSGSTLELIV